MGPTQLKPTSGNVYGRSICLQCCFSHLQVVIQPLLFSAGEGKTFTAWRKVEMKTVGLISDSYIV